MANFEIIYRWTFEEIGFEVFFCTFSSKSYILYKVINFWPSPTSAKLAQLVERRTLDLAVRVRTPVISIYFFSYFVLGTSRTHLQLKKTLILHYLGLGREILPSTIQTFGLF